MTTRGGWMPGTFKLLGLTLCLLGLFNVLALVGAGEQFAGFGLYQPWPGALAYLAVGSLLLWLSRR